VRTYTEAEAAQRWCPFARFKWQSADGHVAGINRGKDGQITAAACCVGSRCMAWRPVALADQSAGRCGLVPLS